MREIEQDLNEGADAIIIKPALAYLDIINEVVSDGNMCSFMQNNQQCLKK